MFKLVRLSGILLQIFKWLMATNFLFIRYLNFALIAVIALFEAVITVETSKTQLPEQSAPVDSRRQSQRRRIFSPNAKALILQSKCDSRQSVLPNLYSRF